MIDKQYYFRSCVLEAEIKGWNEKISHDWLLRTVPIPEKYRKLLFQVLKTEIVERDDYGFKTVIKPEDNNTGVPQGVILSPLLMNLTLDGLNEVVKKNAFILTENGIKTYRWTDPIKISFYMERLKQKPLNKLDLDIRLNKTTHLVRYADNIVVVSKNPESLNNIKQGIEEFLKIRGLSLSEEKTHLNPWKLGSKVDFLGWIKHLINPR